MPRGGIRPGSGRKPSAAPAPENDLSPLDYMLAVMRDPTADPGRRDLMAVAAAPFVHPAAQPKPRPRSPHDQFLPPILRGTI